MQLPPLPRIPFAPHATDAARRFDQWLDEPPGQALLAAERDMLNDWARRVTGQRGLEISAGRGRDLLRDTRLPGHWALTTDSAPGGDLHGTLEALPIARNSLDALLLHHCLEFHDAPHQVLREAAGCVAPGGMLAVVGFHPISLMGLARWLRTGRRRRAWVGRYFRPTRVGDWLQVLGFEVEGLASDFYVLPLADRGRARLRWLDWLGRRLWWRHGSTWLLVARKHAVMMRPLTAPGRRRARPRSTVISVPVARWRQQQRNQ